MIRLFLVDDRAALCEGLRLLLEQAPDLTIVGEAANGQELLDQLPTTPADIVLLDLNRPVLSGITTTKRPRAAYPALPILLLSMGKEPLRIQQALAAGAQGYILKDAVREEVLAGIRLVVAGRRFLCSEVGLSLLEPAVGPNHNTDCRTALYQQAHRRNPPPEYAGKDGLQEHGYSHQLRHCPPATTPIAPARQP